MKTPKSKTLSEKLQEIFEEAQKNAVWKLIGITSIGFLLGTIDAKIKNAPVTKSICLKQKAKQC